MPTIQDMQAAGFNDDEVADWARAQRTKGLAAGFTEQEMNNGLTGIPMPPAIPKSFIDRIAELRPKVSAGAEKEKRTFGQMVEALGESGKQLFDMAVGAANPESWLQMTEHLLNPPQVEDPKTGRRLTNEEVAAQVPTPTDAAQFAAGHILPGLHISPGAISRTVPGPLGDLHEQVIGGLPTNMDFVDAARALHKQQAAPVPFRSTYNLVEKAPEEGSPLANVVARLGENPYRNFEIHENGQPIGIVQTRIRDEGKTIHIDYIGVDRSQSVASLVENNAVATPGTVGSPNSLGLRAMRDLARQFFEDNPAVDKITGFRVSGARTTSADMTITREQVMGFAEEPHNTIPNTERKLLELYTDHGIHPAEVVEDARTDPTIAQDILSINPGLPEHYVGPEVARPPIEITVREPNRGVGGPPEPPRIEPPPIESGKLPPDRQPSPLSSEEALNKILDHLSIGEREPTRGWSFQRLITNWINQVNPVKLLTKADHLPAELDPYVAYRELVASADRANNMLRGGGVWDFNAPERGAVTRSMENILASVRNVEDLNKFRAFASAAHSIELERDGIATGFDQQAALKVVQDHMGKMQPILTELIHFQNKVSQWLLDSGIISHAAYKAMIDKRLIYVPFNRVLDIPLEQAGKGGTMMASNPLRRIIGSERQVIDPLESIIKNTFIKVQMADRNHAAQLLVDFLNKKGEAPITETGMIPAEAPKDVADFAAWLEHYGHSKMVANEWTAFIQSIATPIEGDGTISLFRNGKREFREIDTELARAVRGMDRESLSNMFKFVARWTSLLRAGSTLVPEFGARHMIRDLEYAFITTARGVFSPTWMIRGFMQSLKKGEVFNEWVRAGGANVTYQAFDRRYLQEDLRTLTNETGLMSRSWNVMTSPVLTVGQKASIALNAAIHPLQVFTEAAQSASHLGAYMRAIARDGEPITREKMIRAGWESRETAVDMSRRGAKMQGVNQIVAFANATVQDTARWVEAIIQRPTSTMLKIAVGITIPSILLHESQKEDATYQDLQHWEKDLFWPITTGPMMDTGDGRRGSVGPVIRIPKPWGMGLIFGSLVVRALESIEEHNPDAFRGFLTSLKDMNLPGFIPTPTVPVFESWANKSFFTGRPLISPSQEKTLPEYQYNQYTTETAETIGHLIGKFYPGGLMSPITFEHYVAGWTGQLGKYVLNASDLALRKAGVVPDPPQPTATWADQPFIRAFIARYPSATTQPIEDFHEEYNRREMIYKTWYKMAQSGDAAAMQHLQSIGGEAMFARMIGIQQSLSMMQQLVQNEWKNPDSSPSDKRQLIDKIYGDMISMARIGNQLMKATR